MLLGAILGVDAKHEGCFLNSLRHAVGNSKTARVDESFCSSTAFQVSSLLPAQFPILYANECKCITVVYRWLFLVFK